jgi:hypothetical protein
VQVVDDHVGHVLHVAVDERQHAEAGEQDDGALGGLEDGDGADRLRSLVRVQRKNLSFA